MKHLTATSLFAAALFACLAATLDAEAAGGRRARSVPVRHAPTVLAEGRPVVSQAAAGDAVGAGNGAGASEGLIPSGGITTRGHGDGTRYFGWTQTWESGDRPLAVPSLRPAR